MSYFRELPNLKYQSFLEDSNSSENYLTVKNLFRRCKIREDLKNVFTLFNKYQIEDGSRPDTVAEELYGSSDLDWVVLMSAGIVNVRDEWPLSNYDLYKYAENIHKTNLMATRFYETVEIKDSQNRLILPAGKIVDENFEIRYFDNGFYEHKTGTKVRTGVSNLQYEIRRNDQKRTIFVLRPEYLQQFLLDMKKEMTYSKSSQYVSKDLIRTENTRNTLL